MTTLKNAALPVTNEADVVRVRQAVRTMALEAKFSLVDQTKVVTAASELGRNLLIYGGGGEVRLELLQNGVRHGVRVVFEDHGPGIANIEQALTDGFTSGGGMGLGLGGARRLVNEFEIVSQPAQGTKVTIVKWR